MVLIISLTLLNQILQTHETDDKIKEMMKNVDFYVTPVLNIDGYMFSWKDNTVGAYVSMYICLERN